MADTLVFLLERVRAARVQAFSICLILDDGRLIESAIASQGDLQDDDEMRLIAALRMAEHNLIMRRRDRKCADKAAEA